MSEWSPPPDWTASELEHWKSGWYGLSLSAWMDESVELPQEQDVLKIVTAALAELGFSRMDGLVLRKLESEHGQ